LAIGYRRWEGKKDPYIYKVYRGARKSASFFVFSTIIKILFPLCLVYVLRVKDQGRTKDEPRNNLRTPNHQKSTFVKITVSFTSLIPSLKTTTDDRETTERTPTQLPANKKCCLLIFAIAIGCLVLADFPASFPPFSFLLAVLLCGVPETLVAFWDALCGSAREKSLPLYKKSPQ
jgi:hypothetical protein